MERKRPLGVILGLGCGCLVLVVVGAVVVVGIVSRAPNFDEVGGTELVLELAPPAGQTAEELEAAVEQTMEALRARADGLGKRGIRIQRSGERVIVQIPGSADATREIALFTKVALLEFRMLYEEDEWSQPRVEAVVEAAVAEANLGEQYTDKQLALALQGRIPDDAQVLHHKEFDELSGRLVRQEAYLVQSPAELSGDQIEWVSVQRDQFNVPYIRVELDPAGAQVFSDLSGSNVGRRLAIVLDGKVNSAPMFQEKIPDGVLSISLGDMDSAQALQAAEDLKVILQAGALPAFVSLAHIRKVPPQGGEP